MTEVHQPLHTYYGAGASGTVSSRIDRFYLSPDLVHVLDYDVEAAIVPRVPYTLSSVPPSGTNDSWYIDAHVKSSAQITDHLPLGLRFLRKDRSNKTFTIPKVALDDPAFPDEVDSVWNRCGGGEGNGFADLAEANLSRQREGSLPVLNRVEDNGSLLED